MHTIIGFLLYINFHIIKNEIIEIDRGISVGIISLKNEKEDIKIIKEEEKQPEILAKKEVEKKKSKEKKAKKPIKSILPTEKKNSILQKIPEKKPQEEKEIAKTAEIKKEEIVEEKPQDEPQNKQKIYTDAEVIDDLEQINLSARERFNIKTQLHTCFNRSLKNTETIGINLFVKVRVLQDGTINFDFENVFDIARYEREKNYKQAVDNIINTLELCSPLRNLPIEKYDIWKEFSIKFSQ